MGGGMMGLHWNGENSSFFMVKGRRKWLPNNSQTLKKPTNTYLIPQNL